LLAVVVAATLSGCASVHPAELRGTKDADADDCRRGTGPRAIAACRRVLERPPLSSAFTTPDTRAVVYALRSLHAIILGRRLMQVGQPAEALAVSDVALFIAERFHADQPGQPTRADAEIDKAYALQRASAHALAASALIRLQRWPDATARLREVVGAVPDKSLVWGVLGVAANQAGEFEESSAAFARADALDAAYFTGSRRGHREVWRASQQGRRFELAAFEEELLL
jgi:tetratricopeptide (TPR) repeat protein